VSESLQERSSTNVEKQVAFCNRGLLAAGNLKPCAASSAGFTNKKKKTLAAQHHTGRLAAAPQAVSASALQLASASGQAALVPVVPSLGRLQPDNLLLPQAADGPTFLRTGWST
jgi:hypothetical protein